MICAPAHPRSSFCATSHNALAAQQLVVSPWPTADNNAKSKGFRTAVLGLIKYSLYIECLKKLYFYIARTKANKVKLSQSSLCLISIILVAAMPRVLISVIRFLRKGLEWDQKSAWRLPTNFQGEIPWWGTVAYFELSTSGLDAVRLIQFHSSLWHIPITMNTFPWWKHWEWKHFAPNKASGFNIRGQMCLLHCGILWKTFKLKNLFSSLASLDWVPWLGLFQL